MKVHYRFRQTIYHITYVRWVEAGPVPPGKLDDMPIQGAVISLTDDRREHWVEIPFAG
jgi:hypothetical protein